MVVIFGVVEVSVPVVDEAVVKVVEVVAIVKVHESHSTGHSPRTSSPTKLPRLQEADVYGASCPHSSGSPTPLHNPVVVVAVAVVVVVVRDVVVVDATQESHVIGQSERRSGMVLHCVDVMPSQPFVGSGVRCTPLHPPQSLPLHAPPPSTLVLSQSQVYALVPASVQVPWLEQVTPRQSSTSVSQSAPVHPAMQVQE